MVITMLSTGRSNNRIEIQEVRYVSDAIGNRKKETVTIATVWAYFRHLSGKEVFAAATTRIDTFEGHKEDLTLYCIARKSSHENMTKY